MGLDASGTPEEKEEHEENKKPQRNWRMIGAIVVVVIIALGGGAFAFSSSHSSLPQSTNVYPDNDSTCKSLTTAFSCTITLHAHSGSVTPADVKTVSINGTSATITVTASGASTVIVATIPIATPPCVSGCPPSDAINSIPHIGEIVVDLNDGTEVSVQLGAGGIDT